MRAKTKLKLYFFLLIFTLAVIGIYLLHHVDTSFISAGAILLSASLALCAALLNILFTRKTARESNSLEFQRNLLRDKSYKMHELRAMRAVRERENLHELAQTQFRFDKDSISIRYILNTWERAANAMRHGLYDELYLYEAHKSMVIALSMYFREFIKEAQQRQPSFYENFSWLALKWVIRRDSHSDKTRKTKLRQILAELDKIASHKIH